MPNTLKKGSHGSKVTELQDFLISQGYDLGTSGPKHNGVDSSFGSKTDKAIRDFQEKHHLKADGVVGEDTWAAINKVKMDAIKGEAVSAASGITFKNKKSTTIQPSQDENIVEEYIVDEKSLMKPINPSQNNSSTTQDLQGEEIQTFKPRILGVDLGHGKFIRNGKKVNDSGAVGRDADGHKVTERQVIERVAHKLEEISKNRNHIPILTNDASPEEAQIYGSVAEGDSLKTRFQARKQIVIKNEVDLVLVIHADSNNSKGVQPWQDINFYYHPEQKGSKEFSTIMSENTYGDKKHVKQNHRAISANKGFGDRPVTLVELINMKNPQQVSWAMSEEGATQLATMVLDAAEKSYQQYASLHKGVKKEAKQFANVGVNSDNTNSTQSKNNKNLIKVANTEDTPELPNK